MGDCDYVLKESQLNAVFQAIAELDLMRRSPLNLTTKSHGESASPNALSEASRILRRQAHIQPHCG
jgi:hypothetical protein